MQVKVSACAAGPPHDHVYDVGSLIEPGDHVGRPVAEIGMQPIPLSREEMVAALSLETGGTTEDLTKMTARDVGRDIAWTVPFKGLNAVQQFAQRDLDADYSDDEVLSGFLAACGRRVDELLGRPVQAAASEPTDGAGLTDAAGPGDAARGGRDLVGADADGW